LANYHRPHLLRCFGLSLLFALGSVALLPAADYVSAAGSENVSITGAVLGSHLGTGHFAGDDDHLIFLPLVMRRWPPVPYSPDLNVDEDVLWDGPITLDWYADTPLAEYPIDYYVLEESTSPDFSSVTSYTVLTTSVPYVQARSYGTMEKYYFRVRGHNFWGAGEWSNVRSVLLLNQMDEFTFPQTGWAPRRTSDLDMDAMTAYYQDGVLNTKVEDLYDFAVFSPMRPAPSVPYSIKMRTAIVHQANETSYGIVFGGSDGAFCDVVRINGSNPDGCFYHYYRLNVIWGGYLKYDLKRIDYHEDVAGGGDGGGVRLWKPRYLDWYEGSTNGWNEWEIRVYSSGFAVYVNDNFKGFVSDSTYVNEPYYGIFSSNYEYNGAHFKHDYFRVAPLGGDAASLPGEALKYVDLGLD